MMAREQHLLLTRAAATERPPRPAPGRPYAWLRRHRRWLVPLLAALLLAQMAAAMVTTAVQQTPTIDEPVYVATATDYLHEHRIRYNPEHPPLGKLLIALGVAVADPHYDPSYTGTQGDVGRHLLYESGNDPWRVMLWARLPVIVLTLLFGLVAFAFARELTGTAGGLVALALYAFSPDLIAHGSLATLDVLAAGFVLTSAWLLWRARRRPGLYLPLAGAALGAAVATKMSALPAVPVLTVLAAVSVLAARRGPGLPRRARPDAGPGRARGAGPRGGRHTDIGPERDMHPTGARRDTSPRREREAPGSGGPNTGDDPRRRTPHTDGPGTSDDGRERDTLPTGGPLTRTGRARRVLSALTAPAGPRRRTARSALADAPADRRREVPPALAGAVVVGLVALAVVWAAYLAVDPALRFSPAEPVPALHGLRGRLVDLLPVPGAYRAGMRVQFGMEDYPWQGYLFGHLYTGSLWYYLPAALLVKTPLGLLALGAAGAVAVVAVRRLRPAAPYVLLPPGVLLAAAMTGSRDFGTRYALFVPMSLAVAAACVPRPGRRWTGAAAAALVLFTAVSSLRTFPCYLPYSNEAFGGPARTHRLLHDSNVDWGQDLGRLADRLRRYPGERVWLVYKGSGVPSYYGIHAADPRTVAPQRVHGLLVVSDSVLAKARGRLAELVRSSRPAGDVGHSISLFQR
ncbi:phospholipid carrier-dependent glycosyltransferase [Streptomyces barringtoniae]|uniref:phospholipid carrier-dependent glycosyltransferase n=1 Tax=Streptomyces barringtoniae TaxID=2892029 RepID=UPI001E61D8A8|nr:phospholipid carrier-dependent glycosyltransferase [Streptomyces barringtoniae]MCC5474899.1 phospholipid carrier-dependent glycosyltransferase [Streptomyces barringtoniae]